MQFYQTLLAACMATSAVAQTTTMVNLFIDYINPDVQWAASVVDVIDSTATYAVTCVPGPQATDGCAEGVATATITEGPAMYVATSTVVVSETSATVTESCSFDTSASSATCTATVAANGYGQNNAMTTAYSLTGPSYHQYTVAVTAGAKKLSHSSRSQSVDEDKAVSEGAAPAAALTSMVSIGAGLLTCVAVIMVL